MSVETSNPIHSPTMSHSPTRNHTMPVLKNNATRNEASRKDDGTSRENNSLHSYHLWLKEKQLREEESKKSEVKVEEEDEDSGEETFRVDAVLERGPSPPESEHSNTYEWSYEEQFKQLYEIDEDPERKTFLDEYFEFMKGRGTPVSRIPIMAKQILDLYQLYHLVVKHGGLVQVIRNKQWSKITKGLSLPTSITSAAFTLRTQYLKYLYPYECTMHNFSTPKELQQAIDSNRRDRFSTLYHTEPTMTPARDDRFGSYPINGCDYSVSQPRHHMPHPALTSTHVEMRYGLKRSADSLMSKAYDEYTMESPKVIVLQDGTPSLADGRSGKGSPPSLHVRSRSPIRDNDMRTLAEIEARRRSHHYSYGNKEWDGDARHVIEEEARRRLLDESRSRSTGVVCKDKNCNGIDCQYTRPDIHRHRGHDSFVPMCSCLYCKEYLSRSSSYSPTRRDVSRHHMDGASANSHDSMQLSNSNSSPPRNDLNGASASPLSHNDRKESEGSETPVTTIKMKLPDVRKGGNRIQISLEVGGVLYEGVINAKKPLTNDNTENQDGSSDNEKMDSATNHQRI